MNTHIDKTHDHKRRSVVAEERTCGESAVHFADNRPEATAQRKLQEMANGSLRVKQLRALQEAASRNVPGKRADEPPCASTGLPVQGYFSHQNVALTATQNDHALGWANAVLRGTRRERFNAVMRDSVMDTDLGTWLVSQGIGSTVNAVLSHTGYQEMVSQQLLKSEILFASEMLQEDIGEEITGMDRFEQDVLGVRYGTPETWSYLQGYRFQIDQIGQEAKQGPIVGVEVPYVGVSGSNRRADIELPQDRYIEVKAMATTYDPPLIEKQRFANQASDYAQSGKTVTYRFSNEPPDWVKTVLDTFELAYEVVG